MRFSNFLKKFLENLLKISQQFALFVQTRKNLTRFVKFFEKYAKVIQFRNFLRKFFQNFEKCPPPPEKILATLMTPPNDPLTPPEVPSVAIYDFLNGIYHLIIDVIFEGTNLLSLYKYLLQTYSLYKSKF